MLKTRLPYEEGMKIKAILTRKLVDLYHRDQIRFDQATSSTPYEIAPSIITSIRAWMLQTIEDGRSVHTLSGFHLLSLVDLSQDATITNGKIGPDMIEYPDGLDIDEVLMLIALRLT